ncbi:MAG: acetyl-CoA carboxylase biotin carboxyl carrier protein subunit [Muribaculaceae bacterium]|nr:acetyl-CoA carboxylase biotin carboxyl carrier protein subunit [Muribaculaceae bacterium]MDE5930489.1 acetyl-CoA carboxylase biotin carboxyl carrier protein subunit [Muribaculaceae bacterium]MDE6131147.1 acetyl-CoA carboxylase biotin carboxyl carrier protein subunit [Muribaculaceae bacterium]
MKEYKYKINGNTYKVGVGDIEGNIAQVEVNGVPYKVELAQEAAKNVKVVSTPKPAAAPRTATGEKVISKPAAAAGSYSIKAPLPGVVLSVPVKVGDTVSASDTVLVLEAMKMENAIHAGRDGKVASISVNPGDSVLEGAVLINLE